MTTLVAPVTPAANEPRPVPAVLVEELVKVYGDHRAVDGLSLQVQRGEVFGLLGPNGAGKTTTILVLLGLTERNSGTVRVLDLDPAVEPLAVKRRVGYLPDDVGFYESMTGRQNLRYTARLNRLDSAEAEDRIGDLLRDVGLADAADRPTGTYSRGMRQRLGIADALVGDPDVVVLDEPTIAIDPAGVEEVLSLIRRLAHDRGAAVLLSSHMLEQVEQSCDRVAIFVDGRVRAQGSRADLAGDTTTHEVDVTVPTAHLDRARTLLTAVPGVIGTQQLDETGRLRIRTAADVRSSIARTLVTADVHLLGLRQREVTLAELYRTHFAEQPAADGSTP